WRLPLPDDQTRPEDDGMRKVQLLNGILHTDLHPAVRYIPAQQTSRSRAGDEDVRLYANLLCGLGVLDAEVVIDLPLILDPARRRPGGAHCVEGRGGLGAEVGEHGAPFRRVGFLASLELG